MTWLRRSLLYGYLKNEKQLLHSFKSLRTLLHRSGSVFVWNSNLSNFTFPKSSSQSSSSLKLSVSSSSSTSVVRGRTHFPILPANQSRSSSHSTWETLISQVDALKQLSDEVLLDRLDHLEKINAKLRRTLKRRRPLFRPADEFKRRSYVVEERSGRNVALLVSHVYTVLWMASQFYFVKKSFLKLYDIYIIPVSSIS